VLLGNGDGTFQTAQTSAAGTAPYSVAVGDFNGDGKPDLAVADRWDSVRVLLNQVILVANPVNVSAMAGAPFNGPVATFETGLTQPLPPSRPRSPGVTALLRQGPSVAPGR
jgi:hypothetical protein